MSMTTRFTVTVDTPVAEIARTYAEGNMSAYVTRALRAENLRRGARRYAAWHADLDHSDRSALAVFAAAAEQGRAPWATGTTATETQ